MRRQKSDVAVDVSIVGGDGGEIQDDGRGQKIDQTGDNHQADREPNPQSADVPFDLRRRRWGRGRVSLLVCFHRGWAAAVGGFWIDWFVVMATPRTSPVSHQSGLLQQVSERLVLITLNSTANSRHERSRLLRPAVQGDSRHPFHPPGSPRRGLKRRCEVLRLAHRPSLPGTP